MPAGNFISEHLKLDTTINLHEPNEMTHERFAQLMNPAIKTSITYEEAMEGWHFCLEFDGLLRQPRDENDTTGYSCDCLRKTLKGHNPKRDRK